MSSIVTTERTVTDELLIRALTDRFADAANRRDFDEFRRCWATEGVWDIGEPMNVHVEGVEQIDAAIRKLLDGWEFFVQMPHAGVIETNGERATARWTMNEVGRAKDGQSGQFNLAMYFDELVRQDGEWLFAKRSYRMLYLDGRAPQGKSFPIPEAPGCVRRN